MPSGSRNATGSSIPRSVRSWPTTNWATPIVGIALGGSEAVHKVSIIPRGVGALGYTIQRPTEDRYLMTRDELEAFRCTVVRWFDHVHGRSRPPGSAGNRLYAKPVVHRLNDPIVIAATA